MRVHDTGIKCPQDVLGVEEYVDNALKSLAVTFLLKSPGRVWDEDYLTILLFRDLGQSRWYTGFQAKSI